MSEIISKELLGAILNKDVFSVKFISNQVEIYYNKTGSVYLLINIYELMAKAKKWAYRCGYLLVSAMDWCKIFTIHPFTKEIRDVGSKTEYYAVFKGCQWILDNRFPSDS